jgi:hypothetical protein
MAGGNESSVVHSYPVNDFIRSPRLPAYGQIGSNGIGLRLGSVT